MKVFILKNIKSFFFPKLLSYFHLKTALFAIMRAGHDGRYRTHSE